MTSSVLALTTGLHQTHPPVFIFRSSRPLRATPVQHTARVPPVNNSYCVGLQTRVREQNKLPDTTPEAQDADRARRVLRRVHGRTAMQPKTMRQQNTQQVGNQQATSMRKQPGPQRPQTRAAMTEYQERFLSPRCYTPVAITTRQRDPYHPLKGTKADTSTFGSYYVTYKWVKNPTKAPQPPVQAQGQRRCSTAPPDHFRSLKPSSPNQTEPEATDYTTVYQNDFQMWKASKRQPIRQRDCLKVKHGLVALDQQSGEKGSDKAAGDPMFQEPQAVEGITSYRCDFITHPVQARQRRDMAVYHPNKGLPLEPAASFRPQVTWGTHQGHFDGVGEMHEQFKTWSTETKFNGQVQESGTAADRMFLSTTHRDYMPHKCQRIKPILPNLQTSEKKDKLFQGTTTTREDYRAWDTPHHFPTVRKEEQGWPKRTPISARPPKPAENFQINPEPFGYHST